MDHTFGNWSGICPASWEWTCDSADFELYKPMTID